jgi:hypothetical protein
MKYTPSVDEVRISHEHFDLFRPRTVIYKEYICDDETPSLLTRYHVHTSILLIQECSLEYNHLLKVKVKQSRNRPGVTQRVP